eukprot:359614-Chlamydomonas_euryale.AAC.1
MYVESAENSADFLTEPLPREVFKKHISEIVLKEASAPYGQRVSDSFLYSLWGFGQDRQETPKISVGSTQDARPVIGVQG